MQSLSKGNFSNCKTNDSTTSNFLSNLICMSKCLYLWLSTFHNMILCWDGFFSRKTPFQRILLFEPHVYTLSSPHTSLFTTLHEISIGLPWRGRWKMRLFLRKGAGLSASSKSWSDNLWGFQRLIQPEIFKHILTSKTLSLNLTARSYFDSDGLKLTATKHTLSIRCVRGCSLGRLCCSSSSLFCEEKRHSNHVFQFFCSSHTNLSNK